MSAPGCPHPRHLRRPGGGFALGTNSYGVSAYSDKSYALYVIGTSYFNGAMSKPGGSFQIDRPVDPAAKYL
jgi:hypothetical protein